MQTETDCKSLASADVAFVVDLSNKHILPICVSMKGTV